MLWLAESRRNITRMERAIEVVSVGKFFGGLGTYTNTDPYIKEYVCKKPGFTLSFIST
ncbi:MAG TPA: hypothetical protein GXX38_03880 [Clostridia bacterium]|nr:hypothetical protein [Clostridia bacterium]